MKESDKTALLNLLTTELIEHGRKKTPERMAIFGAACDFSNIFTIEDLTQAVINKCNLMISRGTIYNTLKLLMQLRLVTSYKVSGKICYEVISASSNHIRQICIRCGKLTEVRSNTLANAIKETHLKRFRFGGFMLSIFGVCSSCQAKQTREENKNKIKKKNGKRKS